MKPYLLISALFIMASCGYEDFRCLDGSLTIRLDSFSLDEIDTIIIERYDGPDFVNRTDSFLIGFTNTYFSYYGTESFTMTLTSLGLTYRFSDIRFSGKTTERRRKEIDLGGSYHPTPCYNQITAVTVDGEQYLFNAKNTASLTLQRK